MAATLLPDVLPYDPRNRPPTNTMAGLSPSGPDTRVLVFELLSEDGDRLGPSCSRLTLGVDRRSRANE